MTSLYQRFVALYLRMKERAVAWLFPTDTRVVVPTERLVEEEEERETALPVGTQATMRRAVILQSL